MAVKKRFKYMDRQIHSWIDRQKDNLNLINLITKLHQKDRQMYSWID